MRYALHVITQKLYLRSAKGCTKHPEPHSHHLTTLGRLHYTGKVAAR